MNVPRRKIEVHPETLLVSTQITNFPSEPHVIRAVDGNYCGSYGEYVFLTKDKAKFFITVRPCNPDYLSPTSITTHLEHYCANPSVCSPEELDILCQAIEEALCEVDN